MNKVIVAPGISPKELHEVWSEALNTAAVIPGETMTIVFTPGKYPLPDPGVYVYKEIPTVLRVSSRGAVVRFTRTTDTGEVEISIERPYP